MAKSTAHTKSTMAKPMGHTATHSTQRRNGGDVPQYFSAELIYPWAESTQKMTSVAIGCAAEAVRFAGQRFERTRETVSHLPKCTSWDEVLRLQMDWTSGLMEDYLEESRQYLEIAQRATAEVKRTNGRHSAE